MGRAPHIFVPAIARDYLLLSASDEVHQAVRLYVIEAHLGFAPKVNLRLMVRQAHHERKYENPFALSLSKGDLAEQGTFGAKLLT